MKSTAKTVAVTLSSMAMVLNGSQQAFAQLNIGDYGIQPGLEQNYLQYQVSGRDLSQMRGIPGCNVGFGTACNKAGAVFQKILESNGGPTQEQLLIQAAGGEQNYQNFAAFYGDNPNLTQVPYASFWQNDNPDIVDGYRYLLGQSVDRTPQEGLRQVTQNFYWAPEGGGNSLDPRNALLDLKYAYGRLLLEEVAKIPDVQQQIQSLGLKPEETKFYSEKLSSSMRVLKSGDEQSLKETILKDLSMPYSPEGGEYNRPNLGVPQENWFSEETLAGEVFVPDTPVSLAPELLNVDFPSYLAEDVVLQQGSRNSFPGWLIGGGGLGLLLLLLALGGGDDSSSDQGSSSTAAIYPGSSVSSSGGSNLPVGGDFPTQNQIIEVSSTPLVSSLPGQEVQKVPEPTMVTPLLFMIIFIYVVSYKNWSIQTKG